MIIKQLLCNIIIIDFWTTYLKSEVGSLPKGPETTNLQFKKPIMLLKI